MHRMTTNQCRTCLNPNIKVLPLNKKPKALKVDKTYMDLLKHIAKLEINDSNEPKMPHGICTVCSKKLRDSYIFIEQIYKCNEYYVDLANSILTNRDHINLDKGILKETSIKQESNDAAISRTNLKNTFTISRCCNENASDLLKPVDETASTERFTESESNNVAVKTESESRTEPKELYSECVMNELEFDERGVSSESECSDSEWSYADPLDNEISGDETKPTSIEDEMLPVRCDECGRVFANSILLNRHKKDTHLPDELKIPCPSCPVKFSRRYNMYAHMRTFHKSETVREHQIQPRKLTKTDICNQCHRSYSDKYKLMAHIKNKHGPASVPKKPKQPPKQYLCTLCGLTCTNKSNLEIHYRRRHTGEKPFKCDLCDRGFTRSYEVKVHRRTHTGEAPYKCTVCEKAFKRSNKLKIHMRIHTNERPYKCTECEKAFRESKDLNIHRRTHTGERPYRCNTCNSTFTQSNSLKLHQKKKKHFQEASASSVEFNNHAINTFL